MMPQTTRKRIFSLKSRLKGLRRSSCESRIWSSLVLRWNSICRVLSNVLQHIMDETKSANLYAGTSNIQFEMGKALIDERLRPEKGQHVLDLGCGTGRLTSYLASQVGDEGHVVGVDPNGERVAVAERLFNKSSPHLKFHKGDAMAALSFGPFDSVLSNLVLHWIPDENTPGTLNTVFVSLKPGGHLCANIGVSAGELINSISLVTSGKDHATAAGLYYHPISYWNNLFEAAGFEVIHSVQNDKFKWNFKNIYEVFDFAKAFSSGNIDGYKMTDVQLEELLSQHGISSAEAEVEIHANIIEILAKKPSKL